MLKPSTDTLNPIKGTHPTVVDSLIVCLLQAIKQRTKSHRVLTVHSPLGLMLQHPLLYILSV